MRVWFLGWVLGMRPPTTPAQQRGKDIHEIVEHYYKTGKIEASWPGRDPGAVERSIRLGYVRYVEWMMKADCLPDPKEEHLYIEQQIFLDTPSGLPIGGYDEAQGIPLVGYIDMGRFGLEIPEVRDLKSTTNLRYAKTPAELNQDIQLNTYGRWVFERQSSLHTVRGSHVYCKVEGGDKPAPKTARSTKAFLVSTDITREGNAEVWGRMQGTMAEMVDLASSCSSLDDLGDIEPNVNFCSAYGGCAHKETCGISPKETLYTPNKGTTGMSFLDKVKKAKAEAATQLVEQLATHHEEPQPPARRANGGASGMSFRDRLKNEPIRVAGGPPKAQEADAAEVPSEAAGAAVAAGNKILPPDGARRTTTPERGAELRGEAQEKADKKEKKKAATKRPRKGKHKRELTLYFNCTPQKGEHQGTFVLIEDVMQDILEVVNAEVAEKSDGKVTDYRELSYADEKMALANVVQQYIEEGELPPAIAVLGSGQGLEIANLLVPKATDIVRASK